LDVPPPGVGVNTVTCAVPGVAISLAGIVALSWLAETEVVVRSAPFQRTMEPSTRFVPLTSSVNAPPPDATAEGLRLVIPGIGFGGA
jgi:hypothetical protein